MKKGLIVVSFGTTVSEAEEAIRKVEGRLRNFCDDRFFLRAFTSRIICRKLRSEGRAVLSPEEALEKLAEENVSDVIVMPTHILPGDEYEKLCRITDRYRPGFSALRIGKPLITDRKDLFAVANCVRDHYREDLAGEEALLLMGHGTQHIAGMTYAAMQTSFRLMGENRFYVGTVEGWPDLDDCIRQLKEAGYHTVHLAPLMLVAGDHARNDMAGEDEGSWKNRLQSEGVEVVCHLEGIGAWDSIGKCYQMHLEQIMEEL